jgi:type VI secretion system secreted protein Hcp
MAAVDYFLKIDGITGESTNPAYKESIDIESFSWGLSNSGRAIGSATSGAGAGKVSFQDIHFTAKLSSASPQLMLYCAAGKHFPSATLTGIESGKAQLDYLTIKLTDVIVSSYETTGATGNALAEDQFTLNFAKVEMDYRPQLDTGALGEALVGGWDLRGNLKAAG